MNVQAARSIKKKSLLDFLLGLNARIVLTKNKNEESEGNFRIDPKNSKIMLDGYWVGVPHKVDTGDYCVHFVTHKNEIWIGEYGGTVIEGETEKKKTIYSLIMKNAVLYKIADINVPDNYSDKILINNFLRKNGAVGYAYFPERKSAINLSIDSSLDGRSKPKPYIPVRLPRINQNLEKLKGAEREALFKIRLNQGRLRRICLDHFDNSCCVSGVSVTEVLICSHIKPWAKSSSEEQGDIENTLLLAATLDRLFDRGIISFSDGGKILWSASLPREERKKLYFSTSLKLKNKFLTTGRLKYLAYHRKFIFKN